MRLIELTEVDGTATGVNPDRIVAVCKYGREGAVGSLLYLAGRESPMHVRDEVASIKAKLVRQARETDIDQAGYWADIFKSSQVGEYA